MHLAFTGGDLVLDSKSKDEMVVYTKVCYYLFVVEFFFFRLCVFWLFISKHIRLLSIIVFFYFLCLNVASVWCCDVLLRKQMPMA